jgi:hypothetical protein
MRSRIIHPDICTDARLGKLDPWAQHLFIRLWMLADREGRFKWDADEIHAKTLHFFRGECEALLEMLRASGLIRQYRAGGFTYGDIPNFLKYQRPHPRETPSRIPPISCAAEQASLAFSSDSDEGKPGFTLGEPRSTLGEPNPPCSISVSVSSSVSIGGVARETRESAPAENAPPPIQIEIPQPENTGALATAAGSESIRDLAAELLALGLEVLPGGTIRAITPQAVPRKPPVVETQFAAHGAAQGEARPVEPVQIAGGPVVAAPGAKLAVMPNCADDDLRRVAGSLADLAGLVRLPRPDEAIVQQVLDAGRGASGDEIHTVLVELYRRGRLRDMRSWGLLPVLVGQWAAAA